MLGNPNLKLAWISAAAAAGKTSALNDFKLDVGLSLGLFEDLDALR